MPRFAELKPKYDVGDLVWVAGFDSHTELEQCPHCLGSGVWHVTTPAGEEFDGPCQKCTEGWGEKGSGKVKKSGMIGKAWQGTVGSVRLNTHDDNPIEYMLDETGVGSGTIHPETRLYDSREEAMAEGNRIAKETWDRIQEQNDKNMEQRRRKATRQPWWPKRIVKAAQAAVDAQGDEKKHDKAMHVLALVLSEWDR